MGSVGVVSLSQNYSEGIIFESSRAVFKTTLEMACAQKWKD
jgi:hypothetical protein